MTFCTSCGAARSNPAIRFCTSCGAPLGDGAVASVTEIEPDGAVTAPTSIAASVPGRRRGAGRWIAFGALAVVAIAGAGVLAAYLVGGGSDETVSSGTDVAAPTSSAQRIAASPPTKPLAQTIALRVRRQIAPRQAHLNGQIRLLVNDVTPLQSAVAGARALERSLAQTQSWMARLEPHSALDRSVLRSARATFARHRAYAAFMAGLPGSAVSLPRSDVARAHTRSDAARQSYVLLHEVAPSIPVVPIPPGVHRRLDSFVTKPATPSPIPVVTTPAPVAVPPANVAADEQAIRDVVAAHWQAINSGDYGGAYSYFSPTFKSRNSASGWIADKNVDRPTSSGLSFGGVSVSGSAATVYVSFRTRGSETSAGNTGCNSWNGSYSMTRVGATWTIEKSHLNRTSLDCATYVG